MNNTPGEKCLKGELRNMESKEMIRDSESLMFGLIASDSAFTIKSPDKSSECTVFPETRWQVFGDVPISFISFSTYLL
jgi:hypothetical protein